GALAAVQGRELPVMVGCVPEHYLPVVAGGGERAPVPAEGNPQDGALAAVEGLQFAVVVRCVPEHHRSLSAGGGERAPVRAERNPVDAAAPAERNVDATLAAAQDFRLARALERLEGADHATSRLCGVARSLGLQAQHQSRDEFRFWL